MAKEHEYNKEKKHALCILTTSDTRDESSDRGGRMIREKLESAGHTVLEASICRDDQREIESIIEKWLAYPEVDGIVTTGGTGLGFRDVTPETIMPYFTKKIDGFGELFRMISYTEDVGSKALLSRAEAGIVEDKVIYMLPGSVKAVELAMDRLVLPELHHIIHEITKHLDENDPV